MADLKLLPHNETALASVIDVFEKGGNKTCIIHPTGTGKSYIIAALCNHYDTASFLIITPSNHISPDIAKLCSCDNTTFCTYQALIEASKEEIESMCYDFIVLDEFHHVGAPVWGKQVELLLYRNSDAKIFGTSATPERYSDDNRNMADELFGNNIASRLGLVECFVRGILPTPKIITALYDISREQKKLAKSIADSKHTEDGKRILADKLKNSVIEWQNTNGVDVVLKKHLGNTHNKIIVFTSNLEKLERAIELMGPVFNDIFGKCIILRAHNNYGDAFNSQQYAAFKSEQESTAVMFCVDMFNEGIHVPGVTVSILLRDTESPRIYYQQIGRALSAGTETQPLIIDLVNNFSSALAVKMKQEFDTEKMNAGVVGFNFGGGFKDGGTVYDLTIIDETKGINEVFGGILEEVKGWVANYLKIKEFKDKEGRLPNNSDKDNGSKYKWVQSQKALYWQGKLSDERVMLLRNIGVIFDEININFNKMLLKLKDFIEINNRVPKTRSADKDEKQIAIWLKSKKRSFKSGNLSEENINKISLVTSLKTKKRGVKVTLSNDKWDKHYKCLENYYKIHGHSDIRSTNSNKQLINTSKTIREYIYLNRLSVGQLRQLQDIKFKNSLRLDVWNKMVEEWRSYKNKGSMSVHRLENPKLYNWILAQRKNYNEGKLSAYKIDILTQAGFNFNLNKG